MNAASDHPKLTDLKLRIDESGLAWLGVDRQGSRVNRLSSHVLNELAVVMDFLDGRPPAGLIIYSEKEAGFIAGADIDELEAIETREQAMALVSRGWGLFDRLASLPYPTLALIHGHCLGGGLELALACRHRLVVDQPDTSLALPEVMLGIFPAWGGMRRLSPLIGAPLALEMMLGGKPQDARQAARSGLADAKVPPRLKHQAARLLVLSGRPRRRAKGMPALLDHKRLRRLAARQARKKLNQRDPHQHYQAPRSILEIWTMHDGNALETPELIDQLIRSDTSRNLIRVFKLQERLKSFTKTKAHTAPVKHVHVVGAGVMGGDIAAWCALKGLTVTLQDQDRQRIAQAQGRAWELFTRKTKDARATRAASDRLIPDLGGCGVRSADIVIEAISENAEAKRQLYAKLAPQMKPGAVLATNTSSLTLEELGVGLAAPRQLMGLHFFNPVARMPLVEVVERADCDAEARATCHAFVGQLDKLPLPVRSSPGFLVNAVLAPYMLEAMRCVDEGLRPETVDAAMLAFGMPMGPIELIDTVGLDVARDAGIQLTQSAEVPACLDRHLGRNEFGRKSGRGFYVWAGGKPAKQEISSVPPGLVQRLLAPLLDATQKQVDEAVVADPDLADAGVIFGTGFAPFTGGPLNYKKTQGRSKTG